MMWGILDLCKENVLAIVVTFNRVAMLSECLKSLKSQSFPCDILVVDNASTDDTESFMQSFNDSTLFYVRLEKNIGGAGGFNYGMKWGTENEYKFLWLMDDDCIPQTNALEELMCADKKIGNYGWLSSVALWTDGSECKMNRQKVNKRIYEHIELLKDGIIPALQATFVSCLFKREIVLQYGLPIKEFFIWGDDIEYTRRICVRGKQQGYLIGKSVVTHKMENNTGSDISTESKERLNRFFYAYRNENYLYRKEGVKGIGYYLARCAYHFLRILAKAKDNRVLRLGILLKGFFGGCFFYPRVEFVGVEERK